MYLKTIFLDWDGTLAEEGTTILLSGADTLLNNLLMAKLNVFILTARPHQDPTPAITELLKNKLKLNIPKENILWVGSPEYLGHEKTGDVKANTMQNYCEKNQIKPEFVGFMDDREKYIEAAKKLGIKTLLVRENVGMMPAEAKKFYAEVATPFFLKPIAEFYLKTALEKINALKNSHQNGQKELDTYSLYKETESDIRNALQLFTLCNDKINIVKCQMMACELYQVQHVVNYSLPQEKRQPNDYYARKINHAYDAYNVLTSLPLEGQGETVSAEFKQAVETFFSAIVGQLQSYQTNGVPQIVSDLLQEQKINLKQLIQKFNSASVLNDNLSLKQKEPNNACVVM